MTVLRRVGALSFAKVMGILYALLGLVIGLFVSLFAILGAALGSLSAGAEGGAEAFVGLIFGAGAVLIMPVFYGVLGFVFGLITALLFNLVTRIAGGIELELTGG